MSQLLLAPEGLFPIADTADGQSALQLPIAGTIQGEGLLAGTPSLFLRLAGCNMFCHWLDVSQQVVTCDTVHALDPAKGNYETSSRLVEKILAHCGKIRHLVITGGEPLLQAAALRDLLYELRHCPKAFHITIESNGSLFAPELLPYVNLWSFSPKLHAAFLPTQRLTQDEYIQHLNAWLQAVQLPASIQLKFVVGTREDEQPLLEFLSHLRLRAADTVMLMPLGATREALEASTPIALEMAIRHGFRFAPRLQIMLWGNKVGV